MNKFKAGDKVRIKNYGHLIWYSDMEGLRNWQNLKREIIDMLVWGEDVPKRKVDEEEDFSHLIYKKVENGGFYVDHDAYLVGKVGTIEGSYTDLFGQKGNEQNDHIYSIHGIPGKSAWYNEDQLELV